MDFLVIQPGEMATLADIEGAGVVSTTSGVRMRVNRQITCAGWFCGHVGTVRTIIHRGAAG
jgi:hypothetical protein